MGTSTSSTIKLNLPSGILNNAQGEAKRIGISLQDFIRMLMASYFANPISTRSVSREQALYDQAQKDIVQGNYTDISSKKELREYLRRLDATA
ncbi:MAG: hypothetical protein AAB542_02875 [Patescibacteria group bacterium]